MHLEGNLILIDFCRRHYPEFYHCDVSGYVLDFTWFETSVISCQRKRRSSPTIWSSLSKFSWRSLRMGGGCGPGGFVCMLFISNFTSGGFLTDPDFLRQGFLCFCLPDFLGGQIWICVQLSMQLFLYLASASASSPLLDIPSLRSQPSSHCSHLRKKH